MANSPQAPAAASAFLSQCFSLLREMQNADGGWGFHAGAESRVEPTAWAMRALFSPSGRPDDEAHRRAIAFLQSSRLPDGSWPASPQIPTGSWVTSHVCEVLSGDETSTEFVKAGLQWLCEDFPRDSSPFQRLMSKVFRGSRPVTHDDSLRGWGWTPQTASWVEPTSFALLALCAGGAKVEPSNSAARRELAVGLLYDRMCPGGGWNCGNPRVYGVDGEALVLSTCWALLALHEAPEKPGRALSLRWLAQSFANIESAGSLAAARITLEYYGIVPPAAKHAIGDWSATEIAAQGTHVLSWVAMALDPARRWFGFARVGAAP